MVLTGYLIMETGYSTGCRGDVVRGISDAVKCRDKRGPGSSSQPERQLWPPGSFSPASHVTFRHM